MLTIIYFIYKLYKWALINGYISYAIKSYLYIRYYCIQGLLYYAYTDPGLLVKITYDFIFVHPLDKMLSECYLSIWVYCFYSALLVIIGITGLLYLNLSANKLLNIIKFIFGTLYKTGFRLLLTPYVVGSFIKYRLIPEYNKIISSALISHYSHLVLYYINIFTKFPLIKEFIVVLNIIKNIFIKISDSIYIILFKFIQLNIQLNKSVYNYLDSLYNDKYNYPIYHFKYIIALVQRIFLFFFHFHLFKRVLFFNLLILPPIYINYIYNNYYTIYQYFNLSIHYFNMFCILLKHVSSWAFFYFSHPSIFFKHAKDFYVATEKFSKDNLIYNTIYKGDTYLINIVKDFLNEYITRDVLYIMMICLLFYILYITIAWIKEYNDTGLTVKELKERDHKGTKSINDKLIGRRVDFDYYLIGMNMYEWYYGKWKLPEIILLALPFIVILYVITYNSESVLDEFIEIWSNRITEMEQTIDDLEIDKRNIDKAHIEIDKKLTRLRKANETKIKADSITPNMNLLYKTIDNLRRYK